ncbi:AAA family ATPase [Clostridium hydrogenum]|uniref:AAA family ATPase n=1 Tax=Clostridium hydrogenum TaxID=2855764 RepID=UPI001F2840A3|nr:AAA family ATPase [Clostridium hydrogenum]
MKPLKLVMSGFGPYAGKEEIDFLKLQEEKIFLITGPTGAGKTTIFDAISYAIFGKASGSDREADNFRSDFSCEDILTYVELEFLIKGKKYYIKRIPKQKKKKSRGEGFTEQKADAELKSEDGKIITGVNDVDEKINSIMGINYSQFRQIVMIPQGEFRKLLIADSKDRETIFRRIFGTYAFLRIQENLEFKAKNIYKQIAALVEQRKAYVKNVDCAEREELKELTFSENLNIDSIVNKMLEFNKEDDLKEKEFIKLKGNVQKEYLSLEKKLLSAIENNKKIEQKNKVEKEKLALMEKQDEFQEKESILVRARQAQAALGSEQYYINVKENSLKKKKALETSITQAEAHSMELENSKKRLRAEEENEDVRKKLSDELTKLKDDAEKIKDYESKRINAEKLKSDLLSKKEQEDKNQIKIKALKEKEQILNNKLNEAKDAAAKSLELAKILNEKEILLKKIKKLHEEDKRLLEIRNRWLENKKLFDACEKKYKESKLEYERLNEIYRKGQAGILAQGLLENMPCPVCGALDHPMPAKVLSGVPSEESLKNHEEVYKNLEIQYNNFIAELASANTEGKAQKQVVDNLKEEIDEYVTEDISGLVKEALSKFISVTEEKTIKIIQELKDEIKILDAKRNKESEIKKEIQENKITLETIEKEEIKIREEYTVSYGKYESEISVLEKIKKEIPEDITSIEELNKKINLLKSNYEKMEQALKNAQEIFRKSELLYTSSIAQKKEREEELKNSEAEIKIAGESFKVKLKSLGFLNEDEYSKFKFKEEQIKDIDNNIKNFNEKLKLAVATCKQMEKDIKNTEIIDIEVIKADILAKKSKMEELDKDSKRVFARVKHNKDILKHICRINDMMNEKEESYKVIGELANVSKGENSQRISFERYMLAAYFDDIIDAANIRLRKMNAGRYELNRIKEKMKGRSQQGLELEVFDNYTGKPRHVKTLSGGESFKASLALALGLADVVQAYSGGINLDTMFIDEGFGTLDPESLDNAVQCLINLQSNGRLVGIISHVPELKERINVRLEITSGINGSHAKLNM